MDLHGSAQLDMLRVLAALARKYGGPDEVLELTAEDLAPVKGGISREIEPGVIRFRFVRAGNERRSREDRPGEPARRDRGQYRNIP